jgi:hypothetical protein
MTTKPWAGEKVGREFLDFIAVMVRFHSTKPKDFSHHINHQVSSALPPAPNSYLHNNFQLAGDITITLPVQKAPE